MNNIRALIERGNDGSYGIYIDLKEESLEYTVIGEGKTVHEAIDDFNGCYQDVKNCHKINNIPFTDAQFSFQYDTASFLAYYSKFLTLAGLQRLTGINQGLLSHYINGRKKPRRRTVEKIEKSVIDFGKELSFVRLG